MTTQFIQINPESFFDTNTTLQIIDISSIHHISTPSNPVITIQDNSSKDQIHIFFNVQIHDKNTYIYLQIHQLNESTHYAQYIHTLHVLLSDETIDAENSRNLHVFIIHNIDLTALFVDTDKVFTSENIFKNKDKEIANIDYTHYALYHSSIIEYSTIENYIGAGKNVYEIIKITNEDDTIHKYNYNNININGSMHVLTNLNIFSESTSITININTSMVIVHENMNRDQIELTFNIEQSTSIIIADLYSDFSDIPQDDAYMFFQIQETDIIIFSGSQSDAYYNTKNDWKDILLCILNPTSDPYYIPNNISDKRPISISSIMNINDLYTCVYILDHIDNEYTLRNIDLFLPTDPEERDEKDYIYGISSENISMEITENVLEKGSDRPAQYFEKREDFENDVVFIQIIRRYELLPDRVYINDVSDVLLPKDNVYIQIGKFSYTIDKKIDIFDFSLSEQKYIQFIDNIVYINPSTHFYDNNNMIYPLYHVNENKRYNYFMTNSSSNRIVFHENMQFYNRQTIFYIDKNENNQNIADINVCYITLNKISDPLHYDIDNIDNIDLLEASDNIISIFIKDNYKFNGIDISSISLSNISVSIDINLHIYHNHLTINGSNSNIQMKKINTVGEEGQGGEGEIKKYLLYNTNPDNSILYTLDTRFVSKPDTVEALFFDPVEFKNIKRNSPLSTDILYPANNIYLYDNRLDMSYNSYQLIDITDEKNRIYNYLYYLDETLFFYMSKITSYFDFERRYKPQPTKKIYAFYNNTLQLQNNNKIIIDTNNLGSIQEIHSKNSQENYFYLTNTKVKNIDDICYLPPPSQEESQISNVSNKRFIDIKSRYKKSNILIYDNEVYYNYLEKKEDFNINKLDSTKSYFSYYATNKLHKIEDSQNMYSLQHKYSSNNNYTQLKASQNKNIIHLPNYIVNQSNNLYFIKDTKNDNGTTNHNIESASIKSNIYIQDVDVKKTVFVNGDMIVLNKINLNPVKRKFTFKLSNQSTSNDITTLVETNKVNSYDYKNTKGLIFRKKNELFFILDDNIERRLTSLYFKEKETGKLKRYKLKHDIEPYVIQPTISGDIYYLYNNRPYYMIKNPLYLNFNITACIFSSTFVLCMNSDKNEIFNNELLSIPKTVQLLIVRIHTDRYGNNSFDILFSMNSQLKEIFIPYTIELDEIFYILNKIYENALNDIFDYTLNKKYVLRIPRKYSKDREKYLSLINNKNIERIELY